MLLLDAGLPPPPPPPQANETFAFVGNVTRYAQVWLNVSAEIRSFLEEGKLQQRIRWLQQVGRQGSSAEHPAAGLSSAGSAGGLNPHSSPRPQIAADLRKHPEILNLSDSDLLRDFLDSNFSLTNASVLLQQLDTIDNAACGWIQFMSKVAPPRPAPQPPGGAVPGSPRAFDPPRSPSPNRSAWTSSRASPTRRASSTTRSTRPTKTTSPSLQVRLSLFLPPSAAALFAGVGSCRKLGLVGEQHGLHPCPGSGSP